MAKINVSPKIQQAAEKYLASLRTSRDQLTDDQWKIILNHVTVHRIAPLPLLIFGIICAGISFWTFQLSKKRLSRMIPEQVEEVIFVRSTGEPSATPSKPEQVKKYARAAAECSWSSGAYFAMMIFFLASAFIVHPLMRRQRKTIFRIFLTRKRQLQTDSPANPYASE